MAGSAGVRAGKAFIEIGAVDKTAKVLQAVSKKLAGWSSSLMSMGTKVMGVGATMAAPLSLAVKTFSDIGSELTDMSGRTGLSIESLSALGYAAEQTGASTDDLEKGIRAMQKQLGAGAPSKKFQAVLDGLGLSFDDLAAMDPEQQFETLANAVGAIEDPTQRAAAAMSVFGKSGTKLEPMIAEMQALRDEAQRKGLIVSSQDAAMADTLGDSFGTLWKQVQMVAFQVGAALAPALLDLTASAQDFLAAVIPWISDNREIIVVVAQVAAGIMAAGAALITLGGIVGGVSVAIGALASILSFLASPLVLAIGAVVAIGAALYYFSDTVQGVVAAACETLVAWFGQILEVGVQTWEGIRNAIKAGDWASAMQIAWLGVKLAFLKGTSGLLGYWDSFMQTFLDTWTWLSMRLSNVAIDMWFGVQKAFVKGIDGVQSLIQGVASLLGIELGDFVDTDKWLKDINDQWGIAEKDLQQQEDKAYTKHRTDVQSKQKNRQKAIEDAQQQLNELNEAVADAAENVTREAPKVAAAQKSLPPIERKSFEAKPLSALSELQRGTVEAAKAFIEAESQPFESLENLSKQQVELLERIADGVEDNGVEVEEVG